MRTVGAKWAFWAAIVAATLAVDLPVQAATKAERAEAAKLVDETLRCEARESIDDRRELLRPAVELTPPCEAAYWLSGFAYDLKRKEWLLLDEIQQRAEKDQQLATYRKTRELPGHRAGPDATPRWCARRKLNDQREPIGPRC